MRIVALCKFLTSIICIRCIIHSLSENKSVVFGVLAFTTPDERLRAPSL